MLLYSMCSFHSQVIKSKKPGLHNVSPALSSSFCTVDLKMKTRKSVFSQIDLVILQIAAF